MLHFAIIIVNLRISSRFLGGTRDKRGRLLVRETFFPFHRFRYDEIGRKVLFLTFLRNDLFLTKQKIKIKKKLQRRLCMRFLEKACHVDVIGSKSTPFSNQPGSSTCLKFV